MQIGVAAKIFGATARIGVAAQIVVVATQIVGVAKPTPKINMLRMLITTIGVISDKIR
jgi:hypothetical protein